MNDSKSILESICKWMLAVMMLTMLMSIPALSETYYVDASAGSDNNTGKTQSSAWQTIAKINGTRFQPGDIILLKRGELWEENLDIDEFSPGTAANPVTLGAYGSGAAPIVRRIKTKSDYWIFENFEIDRNKEGGSAFNLVGAQNCIIRNMEIHNGSSDGVNVNGASGLRIENCDIHHFLRGSFSNQEDAHGIAAMDVDGLTIIGTKVHHFSGDAFQCDPDRDTNTSNNILIEDCEFWVGPLAEDFNAFNAGEDPGENAIDTKLVKENWDGVTRMQITIRNTVAHGFIQNGFINNRAAFNMKEKIEAVFDGVTVYNSEIAFRLRGTRGNANVTLKNAVIYDCDKAIRAEDNLSNLKVMNSTFGDGLPTHVQIAGGGNNTGTWDFRNNAFVDNKPTYASASSNIVAQRSDFVDADNRDYRLAGQAASLVDVGETLTDVFQDRLKISRPKGNGHDVGAYEFDSILTGINEPGTAIERFRLDQNYPNPFNPSTSIRFFLPRSSRVVLEVFDITGRAVKSLLNGQLEAGEHELSFEGTALPSGTYFYRLQAGEQAITKSMVLLK